MKVSSLTNIFLLFLSKCYRNFSKNPRTLLSRCPQHSCQNSCNTPVKTPATLLSRLLQDSCQETKAKMTEYLSIFPHCTMTIILGGTPYYLYSLIKMAEGIINELLLEVSHSPLKSGMK